MDSGLETDLTGVKPEALSDYPVKTIPNGKVN
jgi:hypothetical protein